MFLSIRTPDGGGDEVVMVSQGVRGARVARSWDWFSGSRLFEVGGLGMVCWVEICGAPGTVVGWDLGSSLWGPRLVCGLRLWFGFGFGFG